MTPEPLNSRLRLTFAACVLAALGCVALATSLTVPAPSFDLVRGTAAGLPAPIAIAPVDLDPVTVPPATAPAQAPRPAP